MTKIITCSELRYHTLAELEALFRQPAFDDLVAWIENGAEPAGDEVLGEVSQLGIRWTPLRQPKDPQQ